MHGCINVKPVGATNTPLDLLTIMKMHYRTLTATLKTVLCTASLAVALGTTPSQVAFAQPLPSAQTNLPLARLQIGKKTISVQVASTFAQRQTGLMYRKTMPAHDGMLFVFDNDETLCFWMKNTLLPLTAAFISSDGRIINLQDMQPLSEESHCSSQPARYVLEMRQGWFARHGIQPGSKLHDMDGRLFR